MSFCGLEALIASSDPQTIADATDIRMLALFDHEECGSASAHGAASSLLETTMKRITASESHDIVSQMFRKSFVISADMAHAIHPNYKEKHEQCHRPEIHKGLVLKFNANQRYATNSITAAVIRAIAKRHQLPIQDFVVRNDSPCGSTIGPILSMRCGVQTIDVGAPMLSMHSVREMCGTDDLYHSYTLFVAWYQNWLMTLNHLSVDA